MPCSGCPALHGVNPKKKKKEVKVIPGEEILSQHYLLLMDIVFKKKVRSKVKFRKNLKLWTLRESEAKEEFAEGFNNKRDGNEDWCDLKRELLDVTNEDCGYTKGKHRYFETWWWNKDVDVALCRKKELFRILKRVRERKIGRNIVKQKMMFERQWKRLIHALMVVSCLELPNKGLERRNVGVSCLKDESGAVKVSVDDRKKIRK